MSGNNVFRSLEGGGVTVEHIGPQRKIATLYAFDENGRFFTSSCYPYVGQTFRLFFTHFTERTQRMAFEKNA